MRGVVDNAIPVVFVNGVLRGNNKRTFLLNINYVNVADDSMSSVIMDSVSIKMANDDISLDIIDYDSVGKSVNEATPVGVPTLMKINEATPVGGLFSLETHVGVINDVGEINDVLVCRNKSKRERYTHVIDGSLVSNNAFSSIDVKDGSLAGVNE